MVPGALLLLASGAWLSAGFFGGWDFVKVPWLAAILLIIVALGALRPDTWALFAAGGLIAVALAAALTVYVPRLYPWRK